jgi:hypothetical protein
MSRSWESRVKKGIPIILTAAPIPIASREETPRASTKVKRICIIRILKETLPRNKKYPTPLRVLVKKPRVYRGPVNKKNKDFIFSNLLGRF